MSWTTSAQQCVLSASVNKKVSSGSQWWAGTLSSMQAVLTFHVKHNKSPMRIIDIFHCECTLLRGPMPSAKMPGSLSRRSLMALMSPFLTAFSSFMSWNFPFNPVPRCGAASTPLAPPAPSPSLVAGLEIHIPMVASGSGLFQSWLCLRLKTLSNTQQENK